MKTTWLKTAAVLALSLSWLSAHAQASAVKVEGAWARASVQGQMGTGAFMRLTSTEGTRLVAVTSPAAGVSEVHEMKMEGDVMRMRSVAALALPAGQTVELKPGGYHLMLMDLKMPLAKGSTVPLTLVFENAQGVRSTQEVILPVAVVAPAGASSGASASPDGANHHHRAHGTKH